jgi:uncharacterized protein (DUF2147 family)
MKAIKKILALLFFATMISGRLAAQTIEADHVLGIWQTSEKDGKIQIYKIDTKYYGKVIWGNRMFEKDGITSKKDVNNPNANLKSRNMKDLVILTDFVFDNHKWENGEIYDPNSGKTYSCVMELKGNNLKITGYIGITLFGKSVVWSRLQ